VARIGALILGVALGLAQAPAGHARASELVVSAAASLTNAFREIGADFERGHPGDSVAFNFAASDVLLTQIARGAPADVFASADQDAMDKALSQHLIDPATRVDFARNRLVLIVPAGSTPPTALAALADASYRRIASSNPATVPAGRYARAALKKAGLWTDLQAKLIPTQSVRQSLDYVARGECDAGFVYATDAATQPDKVRVAFEVATGVPVLYPAAVVRETAHRALAARFIAHLRAPAARAVLARHGFGVP
jgi:molybdate transport system substrate-binding protein